MHHRPADKMKYVVLVGDGMGDLPLDPLGGRTPLEAAATPAMDELARRGVLYQVRTIPPGMAPGSDVANLSLLGYRPDGFYSGRAPLEAAAMGVELAPAELAFRCNLVTLADEGEDVRLVDYSAGHIDSATAGRLIQALDSELGGDAARFHPGVSYRHLLVARLAQVGFATVPPHDHTGKLVTDHWQRYLDHPLLGPLVTGARLLLADHPLNRERIARGLAPANGIWLWGEGRAPDMPGFRQLHGLGGGLVSAVDLLRGIAVCAGLEAPRIAGATGYLDTDCEAKVAAALDILSRHDYVFVHVEAPDEAGHQGSVTDKVAAIEMFDSRIVGPILAALRQGKEPFRLLVAMDHYTPVAIKTHDPRPVPVVLHDSRWTEEHAALAYTEAHGSRYGDYLADGAALYRVFLSGNGEEAVS